MSVQGGPDIITDGLVLCLDAGNRKSYAGTGTAWYDLTKNGYTGTLTGNPTFSGTNGGGIVLDGVDDYISGALFTPNVTDKTLSAWVKLSSTTQQGGGAINLQISGGSVFDAIVYNETNNGWGFGSNGFTRTSWSGVKETSTNDWVNILATYQTNNYRLYRNGRLIYTDTTYTTYNFNTSSQSFLGYRHTGGASAFLAGTVAMGTIYNRALTASEVLQNFNATKSRFGL